MSERTKVVYGTLGLVILSKKCSVEKYERVVQQVSNHIVVKFIPFQLQDNRLLALIVNCMQKYVVFDLVYIPLAAILRYLLLRMCLH